MFSLAFSVIRTLEYVAVNFLKFESAGVPVMAFEYLSMPILMMSQGLHMMQTMSP